LGPIENGMTTRPEDIRSALLAREEIALLDVREEAEFALGHPLFAAQLPLRRVAVEAPWRIPRKDTRIVVYDAGEGLAVQALAELRELGFTNVDDLAGGLAGWREAGYEVFEDVNSYSKAFGELVEHRRHTPSLPAPDVQALIDQKADIAILDARRFDEYATMSIPSGQSVPGAELVLRAPLAAPDPDTTIIVNCAGRTRSIIGTQSLINAGLPNRIFALRNGTIGWTLAGQQLANGRQESVKGHAAQDIDIARHRARDVAYRAGVRRISDVELAHFQRDAARTLYCFDVRQPADYAAGHLPGFRNAPGGQLVQETDHFAPVRGARIVLADDLGSRADMTASWLAQLGWEVLVLDHDFAGQLDTGGDTAPPARGPEGRYKRPYEGTDNAQAAMQAYLNWEYGLVAQLARDGTHGFFVI
jgi:rhodanese-related sulfurtransferase